MIKHKCFWITWLGFDAITFGHHVFINPKYYDYEPLLKHEQVHVDQYAREGFVLFILKYFWYCIQYGYPDNPFEIEARKGGENVL